MATLGTRDFGEIASSLGL